MKYVTMYKLILTYICSDVDILLQMNDYYPREKDLFNTCGITKGTKSQ